MSTGTPSGSGPTQADSSPDPTLSWEGDRMFNIYIYDYCFKRGFKNTARELLVEADLSSDSQPPINAKQGLLFEWWSVFWVLFTAKSQGQGSEDAMAYTQHQAQQAAQRQRMPQPQVNRFMNGVPRQPGVLPPNGQMPNGVTPALPTGQIPSQGPMPGPFPGVGPPINGIANGANPHGAPTNQSQNFQQMMSNRPQQRGPNGVPPFQSPTLAHSPQHPGGGPGQQPHPPGAMSQMGTPHMAHMSNRGAMLPPNGPQVVMNNSAQQTPQPPFQQVGRPSSRPSTPGQQNPMMTQPSPSMTARQTPSNQMQGADMRQIEAINNELRTIPPQIMMALKQECGLTEKESTTWSIEEKTRVITLWRQRRKPPIPNPIAGPSVTPTMQPQNQRQPQGQQQRAIKRTSTSPADEESLPRTDTSPPDRKRAKRSPSGAEQHQGPMVPFPHSMSQGGPGGPQPMPNGIMRPQQMNGPPMNSFPNQPGMQNMGNNPGMNMMAGMPQMSAMSPGMMNHPGQGGMMNPSMQMSQQFSREAQYRQSMHNLHKNNLPPGALTLMPGGNTNSPQSNENSFNGDGSQGQRPQFQGGLPNTRLSQGKAMGMMPPPPPSPAMNGVSKGQAGGPGKDGPGGEQGSSNGRVEGSPQNPAAGLGQGQGQPSGNPGQPSTAPATPASNTNMTAPSPSQILSNPGSGMNPSASSATDSMASNIFTNDFINSVASSFDDLDPNIFTTNSDINFERDFGQWFNPDDVGALDMSK